MTLNMLKGVKYLLNLHSSIFAKFLDPSEKKSALRILVLLHLKYLECLLSYWHPIASILYE